ncbi:MAG TPA: flagellar biosynthesis anti-sigma factor FlgM [Povalibacter sp.]|uniref:flagellar biosynthesis anti-sigma factor FlgM n=1 Tax=Povalibacter sp. TaxID=1962978 RepID=UPI002CCA1235|nr:flagellar biosynthesis anti-sigma factor FlgM [Povalibacter sp.]HMN43143.1 flagellar biosynthesis anti-sigma factor FlgM [Povalibacter sp.]
MRIVPGIAGAEVAAPAAVAEVTRADTPAAGATASAAGGEALQSAVLQPAIAALDELPDIDHARVAALRDALAKGELPFDARRLAVLIESYHRSGGQ